MPSNARDTIPPPRTKFRTAVWRICARDSEDDSGLWILASHRDPVIQLNQPLFIAFLSTEPEGLAKATGVAVCEAEEEIQIFVVRRVRLGLSGTRVNREGYFSLLSPPLRQDRSQELGNTDVSFQFAKNQVARPDRGAEPISEQTYKL